MDEPGGCSKPNRCRLKSTNNGPLNILAIAVAPNFIAVAEAPVTPNAVFNASPNAAAPVLAKAKIVPPPTAKPTACGKLNLEESCQFSKIRFL